jgi:bzd-type benzoyl-CoA reductase N subunit
MEQIEKLKAVVENPYSYLRKLKETKKKKIVGYVCSYTPEELIEAAGALPVRLFGVNAGISQADLHLQAYCCSLVRGILDEALAGKVDVVDGVVFPHTCDTIQRLSDIWRINLPHMFHADIVLPVKLSSESSRQYFTDVLKRFTKDLERVTGRTIHLEDLRRSIRTYNAIRAQMTRLYDLRGETPQVISGRDYFTLTRAAMIMDREEYLEILTSLVSALTQKAGDAKRGTGRKRLILTGSVCSSPDIYGAVENAGGDVVCDDLCTGSRYFGGQIDEHLPPITAVAQRYAARVICPAKHLSLTARADHLIQMAKHRRADGVVFLLLKFCDPHAFDYPYLKERLDREKIPSLLLEMEEQTQAGGQLETRLETFIQIL